MEILRVPASVIPTLHLFLNELQDSGHGILGYPSIQTPMHGQSGPRTPQTVKIGRFLFSQVRAVQNVYKTFVVVLLLLLKHL